ncbi:MAG TPA: DUF3108 domain-containing protein [Candidatus Competibacter sp.]|nr:DUF3108 domain-containing protein [Candidatus Competibacter sp.]
MKSFLRAVAIIVFLILDPSVAAIADALPVAPFQARYEVYGSGFSIGDAVMTLTTTGLNQYQMSSEVRPNGLAALLVSGQIDEKANGEIRDGTVRPIRYERRVETPKKKQTVQLRFDWSANQIQARDNQEQANLPLSPGVVDPLSLNLRVMWDLQRGRIPEQYALVDDTELKAYQIKNEGEEDLDTSLGKLRTVRISQSKPGKTRVTTFWFAPDLHYLPVRVAQKKNGKEVLRMEIRAVER